ncbi:MAG: hypothetical protein ACI8X5_001871 [Planctomycetota bacterium]|jgi:hypothetical protein
MMKSKAKKISTGVLALTAVAIWIPQIMVGIVQKPTSPRQEYSGDTEGGFGESAEEGAGFMELAAGDHESYNESESNDESPGDSDGSLIARLESTSEQLRAFGGSQRVDLDTLLQHTKKPILGSAIAGLSVTDVEQQGTQQEPIPFLPWSSAQEELVVIDPLVEFCSKNTVNAIIFGQRESIAMLGNRLVREGDELENGIRVSAIEPRQLVLESEFGKRRLSLPPFKAHVNETDGEGANDVPVDESEAESSESPTDSSSAASPDTSLTGLLELQSILDSEFPTHEND